MSSEQPFVLTLKLDRRSFDIFDTLRRQHFPPERNFIPAHVSLFHALPGSEEAVIREMLSAICADTPAVPLNFNRVRFLGKGVAIAADSPELARLHSRLAALWQAWLSPQDRQPFCPHVTIQNKVTPEAAQALHEQLATSWQPFTALGVGLLLWRYDNGPWTLRHTFSFTGGDKAK
jgi:2'-5' RNA ligase